MSGKFFHLRCGCHVTCDNGGEVIISCGSGNPNCQLELFQQVHSDKCQGYCKLCHPEEYANAKAEEGGGSG